MCGICGIFEPGREAAIEQCAVKKMADAIRHRGPDDEGYYCAPGIGLGHRRLSIIDLTGGHQPLSNEDGTIWIAFNGEVYNFEELNRQYLSAGHTFRTRSDTETIVHLYEELGEDCFAELRGMFALALWDSRRKKLLLARDPVGKKPLFYSWNGERLLFGSEIKSLLAIPGIPRDMDLSAVSDYFTFQYVPAPKTIYRDVRKLRPGHYMVVDASGIRETAYWDIRFDQPRELSEDEWCEQFLAEFRKAVKLRLVSDVPLGAFLSGGVDSSSVVAVMNSFQPPVTTCSIGFAEESYDEAADAREFAGALGARHFEQIVEPHALNLVSKLAWHYDEPFADSSAVPTYYVSEVARQHVTVALSGDGGDENFAGYRRYKFDMWENRLRSYVPAPLRRSVFGPLGEIYPKLGWAPRVFRAKSTFQSLARNPIEGYFHGISCCPPAMKSRFFSPDLSKQLNGYDSLDVLRYHYDRANTADPLSRIQYVDIKTYLVDDILVKVDRASMAHALEVRCPLLDHKLMELVAQIPSSLKLRNGQGKYIFKKSLRKILPPEVLTRRKKGFAMPVAEWFRGELKSFAQDALFGRQDGLLNAAFLTNCWKQHQRGQRDWSALLWCTLMFRTWQEVYKAA
ncbi:MAG TPA: XrtA/PEP-CTERM system amidotransferase [Candidatus Acidoferrales bacterium]|nr:XrtA/PEP-CTERM system amidotransferase [Candidatus Acidoferrales bacterium]